MQSSLQELARRLEQQITSFEKLHADELNRVQEQLDTYRRLQNDELQMLRDELKQLKDEIALLKADPVEAPAPAAPASGVRTFTRRELLTGEFRSDSKHSLQS